jgi:integrase
VLRWHVDRLPIGKMTVSDLLFPNEKGGFRARSVLDKPFKGVAKEIALTKHLTPRGMRRTFQDLARAAQVADLVTRSISGHATREMQEHYSTVEGEEQRGALARVVSLARFRQALESSPKGVKEGVKSRSA